MVSLSRKTLRAAQVALQRSPILRTGKRRIIIPWIGKSSIAQFAPEGLLSDLRTGCSTSTGQAAPRHWNNRQNESYKKESTDEKIELIKKLADLHSQGVLTDEEYETKKAELLARM